MGGNRLTATKNIFKSVISGDILLRLRMDRLFPYIFYLFILGWVSILLSYKIEQTMIQAERNDKELEALRIYHAQKTCEYVGLDRISTIEAMLVKQASGVKAPEKPADVLKK